MTPSVLIAIHPDRKVPSGSPGKLGWGDSVLELKAGEQVSGTVEVKVLEDVEFDSFRIGFLWHTEGRGNRATGHGGHTLLKSEGEWRAGDHMSFPFSVCAPKGPLSYKGKLVNVVWELEGRVCRSMLYSDVRECIPVSLDADPESAEHDLGPTLPTAAAMEAVKRGLGGAWFTLGVILLLGSVVFGVLRNWDFLSWERGALVLTIAGGLLLTLKGMWGRLGRGKLGEPAIQLSTTELRRGEEILFSLVLRPEQRTELRSLDVVLECEERVVRGHGQYRSHRRKTVVSKTISLSKDHVVEPHRGLRKRGAISIPEDGPISFGAPDNQVVWWLHFRADIVGWPDWNEPHLLTVRP